MCILNPLTESAMLPPGFSARHYDLPHISLHGVEAGSGPLVLCLHGITANAYVWLPVMERLASRFRVIAIDQRGHGRSDKPAGSAYAAWDYARDVTALIAYLRVDRAILLGHSLGARNALSVGVAAPERVAAIAAIDFVPYIEPDIMDALAARVNGGAREFPSGEAVAAYLRDRYRRLPDDAIARRLRHGYRPGAGANLVPLADPDAMAETCRGLRADLAATVADLRVPAILLRGAESAFVSREALARTRALRPDLPVVEIAGADHYVPEEQPGAVAEALMEFVARPRSG